MFFKVIYMSHWALSSKNMIFKEKTTYSVKKQQKQYIDKMTPR